jgi:pantoate--beta-alanine ligase
MVERIGAVAGAQLDYAAVVDAVTLRTLQVLQGEVLLALAVRFGTTRLIDNVLVQVQK